MKYIWWVITRLIFPLAVIAIGLYFLFPGSWGVWIAKWGLGIGIGLALWFWGFPMAQAKARANDIGEILAVPVIKEISKRVVINGVLIVFGGLWLLVPRLLENYSDQAIPRSTSQIVFTLLFPFIMGGVWALNQLPGKPSHAAGLSFVLAIGIMALNLTYHQNRKVLAPAIYQQTAGANQTCVGWHEHTDGVCWSYLSSRKIENKGSSETVVEAEKNLAPTHDQPAVENRYYGVVGQKTGVLCASHNQEFLFLEPKIQQDLELRLRNEREAQKAKVKEAISNIPTPSLSSVWAPRAQVVAAPRKIPVGSGVQVVEVTSEWSRMVPLNPWEKFAWRVVESSSTDWELEVKTGDGKCYISSPTKFPRLPQLTDPRFYVLQFRSLQGGMMTVEVSTSPH